MIESPPAPRTASRAPKPPATPGPNLPSGWRGALLLGALLVGALVAVLLFATIAERLWYRGRVLPSVQVQSVKVSGATEESARAKVGAAAQIVEQQPVTATADGQTLTMNPGLVDTRVDVDATVRAARTAGRSTNPFDAALGTLLRRFRPDRVDLVVEVDDAKLAGVVSGWVDQASAGRANAEVKITGTTVTVTEPRTGVGIEPPATRAGILAALARTDDRTFTLKAGRATPDISLAAANAAADKARRILAEPVTVTVNGAPLVLAPDKVAPTLTFTPKNNELVVGVDPAKLRTAFGSGLAAFEKAPVNATFSVQGTSVSVVPAQTGIQLDLDAVGAAIAANQHQIVGNLREVQPERSTEWAQKLNIVEQVASFTTNHPSGQERVKNIHRAADVVNNTIVEPGETFSLNDKLGRRTAENGYVKAPVYNQGEFQEDFGGGVSQFTTTLYNATFFGGYKDIAHAPHSIYISRYPLGREATLNYGSIDLKFQNDSNSGILIRTAYTNTSITVTLYGAKEGRTVKAEGPNVLDETEAETEYVEDPSLPPGSEKQIQEGHPRIVVENFRIISRPGQPDKRERYTWTYEMMKRKVARNTAAAPAASTTPTTKPD